MEHQSPTSTNTPITTPTPPSPTTQPIPNQNPPQVEKPRKLKKVALITIPILLLILLTEAVIIFVLPALQNRNTNSFITNLLNKTQSLPTLPQPKELTQSTNPSGTTTTSKRNSQKSPSTKDQPVKPSPTNNYPNCFPSTPTPTIVGGMPMPPTITELTERCPIYLIEQFKNQSGGSAFDSDNQITIFHSGVTYTLTQTKPTYDFTSVAYDTETNLIIKHFILDQTRDIHFDQTQVSAHIVSYRYCTEENDLTCTEISQLLIAQTPSGFWLEFGGDHVDQFINNTIQEPLKLVQL
jgi:hypothetical protein